MSTCILAARLVPSERVGPMPPALRIWTRIRKYAFRETAPRRRLHRHSWCVSGGCRHMLPCNAFAQAMACVDRPIGSHGRFHSGRWGMYRGVRVRRMDYQRRARVSDLDRGKDRRCRTCFGWPYRSTSTDRTEYVSPRGTSSKCPVRGPGGLPAEHVVEQPQSSRSSAPTRCPSTPLSRALLPSTP